MSERIITLFGEEIVPEQPKPPAKTRARKKPGQPDAEEQELLPAEPAQASTTGTEPGPAETSVDAAETTNNEPWETAPVAESNVAEVDAVNTQQADIAEEVMPEEPAISLATEIPTEPTASDASEMAETQTSTAADNEEETQAGPAKKEAVQLAKLPDNWEGTKQYYTIGEVAELFKVKTSHIRFWTNEFKLKVRTTRKGDRLYTPEQIKKLKAINNLVKERGFTLKGAKSKLKTSEKIEVESVDLKQSLLQLKSKLQAIRNQLK